MDKTHAKIQFKGTEILKILSHKPSHLSFHPVPPTRISFHCVLSQKPTKSTLTHSHKFFMIFFFSMSSLSQAIMDIKFGQFSNDMDDLGLTMRLFFCGRLP